MSLSLNRFFYTANPIHKPRLHEAKKSMIGKVYRKRSGEISRDIIPWPEELIVKDYDDEKLLKCESTIPSIHNPGMDFSRIDYRSIMNYYEQI